MKKIFIALGICLIFAVRFLQYENSHQSRIPENWFQVKQTVTGIVIRDPDRGISRTRIIIKTIHGRLLVTLPTGVHVFYGDEITVHGNIQKPEPFETDTQRIFFYPQYLAVRDIFATMRAETFVIHGQNYGNNGIAFLYRLKYRLVVIMTQLLDTDQAALVAGIVIGEQSLFTREALDYFQKSGLTHIIVLSGYNITIVMTFFITLFSYLGFGYYSRRIAGMVAVPLFIIMTGMGTSLVRAGIMAIMSSLLIIMFRTQYSFRILVITAGVMIFLNPRIMLYSPSFHLSFLSFIGLAYVVPLIKEKTDTLRSWFGVRDIVVETISIQAFVMPYILWMNGHISIASIIANTIIVPIVPLIMFGGFFATITARLFFPLGNVFIKPIACLADYVLWVAQATGGFTRVSTIVKPFSVWWMIGGYGIIICIISYFYQRKYAQKHITKITNS